MRWFPVVYLADNGEQLVQGRYAVTRGRFEPATFRLQGTEHTPSPLRPTYIHTYMHAYIHTGAMEGGIDSSIIMETHVELTRSRDESSHRL